MIIPKQSIFGLLGPNGAGKTTLISMLCGLFSPSAGKIITNGWDTAVDSKKIKQIIGVVPHEIALYPKLTAYENLLFLGHMYGTETDELKQRIKYNLEVLGLFEHKDQLIKTFSGGMKRRINLIAGLLHHPQLLILDEPTVGVDIQSKTAIINYLKKLNSEKGMTIFYTSHHLDEAEDFCSHIAIIDEGKLITEGSKVFGLVRKISIYFEYELIPPADGPLKSMDIGSAQAQFPGSFLNKQLTGKFRQQVFYNLCSAVR